MSEPLPIEAKWPITDRSKLQLFSLNTPNGIKIAVALEELGLPYEAHKVRIGQGDARRQSKTFSRLVTSSVAGRWPSR